MTPRQLKTLGELLYGSCWKTAMANDLCVHRRTVIGWSESKWTIPRARAGAVKELASKRILAIRTALKALGSTRASRYRTD
jgi:hypothetical protein